MSVKRKLSGIHDPNENKEMVSLNESGANSKPAEPNEKDYKVGYPYKLIRLRNKNTYSISESFCIVITN